MTEYLFIVTAVLAAVAIPLIGMMAVIGLANLNQNRKNGFLHFAPYAILLTVAADVLFSGRTLDNISELLRATGGRGSVNLWLVRLVTVFLLFASLERILAAARINRHLLGSKPLLTWTFGLFWLGSVGLNMVVSAHPYFAHEYFYSLILGLGVLSFSSEDANKFIYALRNGLILFLVVSFLMILIKPSLVIESGYSQGYIAGLPRMAGLAPHAVTLGQFALLVMLLLVIYPIQKVWLQRVTLVMVIVALFMAQSKTVWVSTLVCLAIMFWYRYKLRLQNSPTLNQNVALPVLTVVILSLTGLVAFYLFSGIGDAIERFLNSSEGSQLTTLTGRDIIWDFALAEWSKFPIFGYGPKFLNFDQRVSIGLLNATHAHNQFIDLMARSGTVGLLSIFPYLTAIWLMIRKLNLASKGFALAFLMALLIRSVSEVPFAMYGYSSELLMHLGLLVTLLFSPRSVVDSSLAANRQSKRRVI